MRYDRKTGGLQATDLGRIASHYYITYHTLATFRYRFRGGVPRVVSLLLNVYQEEATCRRRLCIQPGLARTVHVEREHACCWVCIWRIQGSHTLPAVLCSDHLKPTMGDIELCRVFSLADEFKYMIVR